MRKSFVLAPLHLGILQGGSTIPHACMNTHVYIYMYVCIYLSIFLSIYLSFYLSFYLSIYLSRYLSMYLCMHMRYVYTIHRKVKTVQVNVNNNSKPYLVYVSKCLAASKLMATIPHLVFPGFMQCIEHLMRQQKRDCSFLHVQLVLSLQGMTLKMGIFFGTHYNLSFR